VRIVSKAELLMMPVGTPFAEYRAETGWWPEGFMVFAGPDGFNDFYYRSINTPENSGSDQLFERWEEMGRSSKVSYPVETDISRDGMYNPESLYLVWGAVDVERIINLLHGHDDPRDERD
jgi:hypothetical protein